MDAYKQQLKDYITQQKQHGQPAENIRAALVQHGWDAGMVDDALSELAAPTAAGVSLPEPVAGFGQPVANQATQQPNYEQPGNTQSQSGFGQPIAEQPEQPQPITVQHPTQPQAATYDQVSGDTIPKPTQKYKVFTAIGDSVRSIMRNFKEFAAVALLSVAAVFALTIGIGFLIISVMLTRALNADLPGFMTLALTIGLILLAYIMTTAATTFVQIVTTMAINEGAEGRRTSIRAIMQAGMQRIIPVIITNILIGLIAIGPLLVVSCIVLVMAFSSRFGGGMEGGSLLGLILLQMATIVWIFIVLFRYPLASQVAMLEPGGTPRQYLSRSRKLLQGGGRWFIFKGMLLLVLIVVLIAAISGQTINELQSASNPLLTVFLIIIEVIANGVLVMLYRNRKLVKDGAGETPQQFAA